MDCCNYVPYRQHQGYYGYYNELLPPYHGEFYGHHNMYHDYYGNINPYYSPHHWQAAGVFANQDYAYNPKEGRLRKAAAVTRDRSIGSSPILPRPNARRAGSAWATPGSATVGAAGTITPHEEPLMMSPLSQGMRGPGLDSPCFPMSNPGMTGSGNEQFMPPSMSPAAVAAASAAAAAAAASYTAKMHQDSTLPLPPAPATVVHPSYMQTNPLSQLQQQTEMWHNYQEDIRPRSSGNPYMMPDMQSPYHHHQPSPPLSIPSPMMMDQHRQTPVHHIHSINPISMPMTPPHSNSIMSMTPPHSNENVPPDELKDKVLSDDGDSKHSVEAPQPLMENNIQEYGNNVYVGISQHQRNHGQQFEKAEDIKIKRTTATPSPRASFTSSKKPSSKPLPDFNEAFGSTERGRFQSPPDPRLGPNKGYLDLFCEDGSPLIFN